MRSNAIARSVPVYTHEGGSASLHVTPLQQLRRSVLACMLFEQEFYESGQSIHDRICTLIKTCVDDEQAQAVGDLAIEARDKFHLRHVPLFLVAELSKYPSAAKVGGLLPNVISRADELAEFLAIYWTRKRSNGKNRPLAKQVKIGLAAAFKKFDEYSLGKYNRDNEIKLRDVLFLCHAKPDDDQQAALWKRLIDGTIATPDTWEVALSGGADKREAFTRLLNEEKLGYMALLRNLRNMTEAGVSTPLIAAALACGATKSKALPFRFIAAARACPQMEPYLDIAMQAASQGLDKLPGKTALLVDVSGSMLQRLSHKSDLNRIDAATALAVLCREICEDVVVFTFSSRVVVCPPRRGMALVDAVVGSQAHGCTYLGGALSEIKEQTKDTQEFVRTIVITDEQSHDTVPSPMGKGYIINVASNKNGIGYGTWTKIDGMSEAVIQYIVEMEKQDV